MDFSKLLHEFSMLLHGFVKLVTCFPRPLPTKTKQKLDQLLKKLNRVYDLGPLRLWQCLYLFVISKRNETNTTLHQHFINTSPHWGHFHGKHTISKGLYKPNKNQAKGSASLRQKWSTECYFQITWKQCWLLRREKKISKYDFLQLTHALN